MQELWTERYRPKELDGYVFQNTQQLEQIATWVVQETIPHLLFSGAPGVGKTTLAKILIHQLGVDDYDVLEINASRENSVDTIRDKITGFVQTMPFGKFKIVLLDEADYMSPNGQAALRGVMEMYASTARFILTCNYPHKIIPALHSRCQGFHIDKIDTEQFKLRMEKVLVTENVKFAPDVLDTYIKSTYPDLRKCLNLCQMNTLDGELRTPADSGSSSQDWKLSAVDLFKAGKTNEARKLLCSSVRPEEMEEMYRWLYDNLDLFSTDPEKQDEAIIIIRNALVNVSFVSDQEINLSACLAELVRL
jgi:DNA polymerase III delta prime subunit